MEAFFSRVEAHVVFAKLDRNCTFAVMLDAVVFKESLTSKTTVARTMKSRFGAPAIP